MKIEISTELTPERVNAHFPIDKEPRISTLDKPVIIESAYPGWQQGGKRFPAVPTTIDQQVKEIVDSVKAGAIAIHVHPRDPKTGNAVVNPHMLHEILEPVFEQVDCVTLMHTWAAKEEADYISETQLLMELGRGNKYCQGSVVLPSGYLSVTGAFHSPRAVIEGVKFLEANRIKPIYQLYDTFVAWGIKQHVIDPGHSSWKPHVFNLHMGKHHSHAIQKDPWAYLQLITNFNMVKDTIPDSIIGVYPGGRNWLPVCTLALLMGAQLIRVGIEDTYWVYPHRDEIIKKNSDMVQLVVEIATRLGRKVVTDANEARKILGMERTSKDARHVETKRQLSTV